MGENRGGHLPVKLFFALMAQEEQALARVEERLVDEFGPFDVRGETYDFDHFTTYYAAEFGAGLRKRIVAARGLVAPERLVAVKLQTNDMERGRARAAMESENTSEEGAGGTDGRRRDVNIDPGYLCLAKVVLASTKDHAHRLYIAEGIYEEVTLSYRRAAGGFEPNPWTYPDYRDAARIDFFNRLRQVYCAQVRPAR